MKALHLGRALRVSMITVLWVSGCAQATAPVATSTAGAGGERSATVGDLAGTVNGRASQAEVLGPVSVGFRLAGGGEVQTGEASKARLDFKDGAILRLAANSSFVLQAVDEAGEGGLQADVGLSFGKLWVSLFGGEVQVETPVGVAAVRGSFAVFSYTPGDPNDPNDDLLVVDCLEGACSASNATVNEALGNLERVVLGRTGSLRQELTSADVEQFLAENPESGRLVATLTAAPPETDTPEPATVTPTLGVTVAPDTATSTPTDTDTPTSGEAANSSGTQSLTPATAPPRVAILGVHVVQVGETLFCLGRGYGVQPGAIAAANNLDALASLRIGQRLNIPAVQWTNITPGPVCAPQFRSPFQGLPTSTPTIVRAAPSGTPTPACAPNEFFDPVMKICRSLAAVTAANPTSTPIPLPTTAVPSATPDMQGPTITNLTVNPPTAGATFGCNVTFSADISDPAGVSTSSPPQVNWTATNTASQVTTGTVAMTQQSPTTWTAGWTVTFSPSFPYYGTVTWSVTATDNLGNSNTVGAASSLSVITPGCI